MLAVLTWLTIIVTAIVVVVLAVYLILILVALRSVGGGPRSDLARLAAGLEAIDRDTAPLPQDLPTINGALNRLLETLSAVNDHLNTTARGLGL